ncbi:MAG: putative DNA-binding domain-containing protein [Gammaproteobacteria bacterium]|nr:putative DNA-binding domain-containing protein [Gammaproteobacteria bacterium]
MSASLRELQENFQAYVLEGDKNILESISTEYNNAVERIDIYKKGYVLRLLEILEKDFPLLRDMLGEEAFTKIGREYIQSFPSDHFSICNFSRHFSKFVLDVHAQLFWSEFATFEWVTSQVLDAADARHIAIAELGTVAPESWPYIQFTFHPSVVLHQFHYNVPQIAYAMMIEQESLPEAVHNEAKVTWVIWRFELKPFFESVTTEQVWMIEALKQGKTFAEICEGLCQWLPEEEVAMFAAGSLRNWIEKGLFSELSIAESTIMVDAEAAAV